LLPSSNASFGASFNQGGSNIVQGVEIKGADLYSTNFNFSLNYFINGAALYAPKAVRANREATIANITGSAETLRGQVTQSYLTALQSQAQAVLQDSLVLTTQVQLDLASAKFELGAATLLDVRNAEVARGQSQVNQLNAHNQARVDKVRLGQAIGAPVSPETKLTSTFTIGAPAYSLDSLIMFARQNNPVLVAARANERATTAGLKIAKMQYTPGVSLGTGYGKQAVDNASFPFNYQKRPYGVSMGVSVPIFNGFQREQNVENARINHDNAEYDLRERELQLTGDITQAFGTLMTALQTVQLQEKTAEAARQALQFAQERYRVGASSFVDLTIARGQFEQAQAARINSVYDYHKALAGLEIAVGRPLR